MLDSDRYFFTAWSEYLDCMRVANVPWRLLLNPVTYCRTRVSVRIPAV